jgi:hypothetical protein
LYAHLNNDEAAEAHRALAESHILKIADSFLREEPLRAIFLAADPCVAF